jgi:pentatricopeptide repeat protein
LVSVEENCYRFDHARSREALYEELSPPLKRGYHASTADKLESKKDAAMPLSDLAYHYAQAGNKEKSLKYALAAANDELARFSNAQAIKHFLYVLQNIPDGHVEEKRTALEGLGDAYANNSMYAEAIKTFDELAASETGVVRLRALRKATDAAYRKGDKPDLLLEYAKKAEELAAFDRLEMARIINNRGRAFGWAGRGDPKMDVADYEAALQVFEEENSIPDVAEALWRSGAATLSDEGFSKLLRSVVIFREIGDARKELEATLYTGSKLLSRGLFPEAKREFNRVLRIGERALTGIFTELAGASSFLSWLEEHDGKLDEALVQALKWLEYSKKTDAMFFLYDTFVRVYSKLGDLKHADEYFDKMTKLPPEILLMPFFGSLVDSAKAVYFAAKGRWEESNQVFERLVSSRILGLPPPLGYEMGHRGDYAWTLERQGRFEEARVQRDRIQRMMAQVEETFEHANVQMSIMVLRKVQVGEEFEMRFDLVNASRRPGALVKIAGAVPPEFKTVALPSFCSLQSGSVAMKEKSVDPFQVETVKLKLEATKASSYILNPEVVYVDDLGNTKVFKVNPITVTAQPVKPAYEALPGRITTGNTKLDRLLLGGMPEKYAIILAAPSSDERSLLIKRFLEAGIEAGETTFHLTEEAANTKALAEKHPSNFQLFLCNPQADVMIQSAPNVSKLKGVENLTEIDIALTKAFRALSPSTADARRICIETISDILLQHHAVTTRRWLSALLPTLKSKGFTILAVIDPGMHPAEETQAVLGLFDGEISIHEKETPKGTVRFLKIKRMTGQKYLKDEISLTEE